MRSRRLEKIHLHYQIPVYNTRSLTVASQFCALSYGRVAISRALLRSRLKLTAVKHFALAISDGRP